VNNKGFASITFIAVFLIMLTLVLEIFFVYEAYRAAKVDIGQTLHIILNDSFNKDLREGISTIDVNKAMSLIDNEINSLLDNKIYKDYVEIVFTERDISSYPASIICKGNIKINPMLTKGLGVDELSLTLPFKSKAFVQIK